MNSLMSYDIPKSNIIGFGSDGCNVMMGENNSVSSRFKTHCPGKLNLIHIKKLFIFIYLNYVRHIRDYMCMSFRTFMCK